MSSLPIDLSKKIWDLYQTHGVPFEVSYDILSENNLKWDVEYLESLISSHQKLSQTVAKGVFKAGIGGVTNKTKALHTTTHVLHSVLKKLVEDSVHQIGSNITEEKARFDINFPSVDISTELLEQVEQEVNNILQKELKMDFIETTPENAIEIGAIGLFGEKYGDKVKVYSLTDKDGHVYSREFCSGPHISNTNEIKKFTILKKKSIGNGQTRIEFDVELS